MFDIGWMELLLIGIVALIVVGPKELPQLFKTVGVFMGKARGMAREFQRSMEQAANESGLKDATKDLNEAAQGLNSIRKVNLNAATASARKYAENAVTGAGKASAEPRPVEPVKPAAPESAAKGPDVPEPKAAGEGGTGPGAP
jgi:sec-independent protein translocase protein TatB